MDNYYELCDKPSMSFYPSFLEKLKLITNIASSFVDKNILKRYQEDYAIYRNFKNINFYTITNIVWPDVIDKIITKYQTFPSDYFIKIIMFTQIHNKTIVNPPIMLPPLLIQNFSYVHMHYNKLLIIDALLEQGSCPRYQDQNTYIYSEHSGVISLEDNTIDSIIVSTKTDRTDSQPTKIFLPNNIPIFKDYTILFHTHPKTKTYGGRIKEGILYEFPSVSDLMNFVKYHNIGKVQLSLIAAPEGLYIIRPLFYESKIKVNMNMFYELKEYILKLEAISLLDYQDILDELIDADIFNKFVSTNYKYINLYNDAIKENNLFIEYYPREKKNNEWCLTPVDLQIIL